jgi:hypothetical protein
MITKGIAVVGITALGVQTFQSKHGRVFKKYSHHDDKKCFIVDMTDKAKFYSCYKLDPRIKTKVHKLVFPYLNGSHGRRANPVSRPKS